MGFGAFERGEKVQDVDSGSEVFEESLIREKFGWL